MVVAFVPGCSVSMIMIVVVVTVLDVPVLVVTVLVVTVLVVTVLVVTVLVVTVLVVTAAVVSVVPVCVVHPISVSVGRNRRTRIAGAGRGDARRGGRRPQWTTGAPGRLYRTPRGTTC